MLVVDEIKFVVFVWIRKGINEGFLFDDVIRLCVVLEIFSIERDYVKNLEYVVEVR